jgi:hypothetical protein
MKNLLEPPLSRFTRFFLRWLFPLPFSVVGTVAIFFQTQAFYRANQSKTWPRTSGAIEVMQGEYRRTLSYTYKIDETQYSSDRVIFGDFGNRNRSREWNIVSELPTGTNVAVFYSPQNPSLSTLFTDTRDGGWFNLCYGAACFVSGFTILIFMPKVIKKAEQAHGEQRLTRLESIDET